MYRMGVSKNRGTPKASILIGFSTINHPFWGFSPYFWKHPYSFGPVQTLANPVDTEKLMKIPGVKIVMIVIFPLDCEPGIN